MTRHRPLTLVIVLGFVIPTWGQELDLQDAIPSSLSNEFDPCEATGDGALFKPLGEIKAILTEDGERLPPDCASSRFNSQTNGSQARFASDVDFHWKPTDFFHMPAYFDDVPLERYGQSIAPRLQPAISGAKFVLQIPAFPYKVGIDRPHDCITTLGHRPPGDCVPCIRQRLPKELDASVIQGATTVGLVFLLP